MAHKMQGGEDLCPLPNLLSIEICPLVCRALGSGARNQGIETNLLLIRIAPPSLSRGDRRHATGSYCPEEGTVSLSELGTLWHRIDPIGTLTILPG